jgi:hypothetical protein
MSYTGHFSPIKGRSLPLFGDAGPDVARAGRYKLLFFNALALADEAAPFGKSVATETR